MRVFIFRFYQFGIPNHVRKSKQVWVELKSWIKLLTIVQFGHQTLVAHTDFDAKNISVS